MSGETDRVKWRGVRPVEGVSGIWPERNATRVAEQAQQAGIGVSIIYTVPANKKLFISNVGLSSSLSTDQETLSYVGVQNGVDELQYYLLFQDFKLKGQTSNFVSYFPALEAEAAWDVIVKGFHNNLAARGFCFGWLENA